MRVVRYVGMGEDERHLLVETVEGDEKFSLYITDELRQAASIDLPRLNQRAIEATISPRDIQVRVRSGESPEEIASESGMALNRVLRFASAVVQERARITGEARVARARRNNDDGEFVVFGEHVDARFLTHGIDPASVTWDSYRNDDGAWVVSAGWHGGDLKRVARWTFALAGRTVSPVDDTAADLLSDRPIRPVVHVVYDMPISNPADSPTGPIPTGFRDELFDQNAPRGVVWPPPAAVVADDDSDFSVAIEDAPTIFEPAPAPGPAPDSAESDRIAVLPLRGLTEPVPLIPGLVEETDDEHAARARIPSWDDILLGVRRKRD
jgi:hypothetical protein